MTPEEVVENLKDVSDEFLNLEDETNGSIYLQMSQTVALLNCDLKHREITLAQSQALISELCGTIRLLETELLKELNYRNAIADLPHINRISEAMSALWTTGDVALTRHIRGYTLDLAQRPDLLQCSSELRKIAYDL